MSADLLSEWHAMSSGMVWQTEFDNLSYYWQFLICLHAGDWHIIWGEVCWHKTIQTFLIKEMSLKMISIDGGICIDVSHIPECWFASNHQNVQCHINHVHSIPELYYQWFVDGVLMSDSGECCFFTPILIIHESTEWICFISSLPVSCKLLVSFVFNSFCLLCFIIDQEEIILLDRWFQSSIKTWIVDDMLPPLVSKLLFSHLVIYKALGSIPWSINIMKRMKKGIV